MDAKSFQKLFKLVGQVLQKKSKNGMFRFEESDTTDFVSIFTASGYAASFESGTPLFFIVV